MVASDDEAGACAVGRRVSDASVLIAVHTRVIGDQVLGQCCRGIEWRSWKCGFSDVGNVCVPGVAMGVPDAAS